MGVLFFCFFSSLIVIVIFALYVLYFSSARCRVGHPNVSYKFSNRTKKNTLMLGSFDLCDAERNAAITCLLKLIAFINGDLDPINVILLEPGFLILDVIYRRACTTESDNEGLIPAILVVVESPRVE